MDASVRSHRFQSTDQVLTMQSSAPLNRLVRQGPMDDAGGRLSVQTARELATLACTSTRQATLSRRRATISGMCVHVHTHSLRHKSVVSWTRKLAHLARTAFKHVGGHGKQRSPGHAVFQGHSAVGAGVSIPSLAILHSTRGGDQPQTTAGHSWRIEHGVQSVLSLESQRIRRVA